MKWGYHHVRKHQQIYCQTAKTHGETNPFASKKNRGLQAVREWQVFICIVGRSFGSFGRRMSWLFPPSKKKVRQKRKNVVLMLFLLSLDALNSFFTYVSHHMNPLATQNLMHFSTVPLLCTCCFPRETIGYFLDFSKYGSEWPSNSSQARGTFWSLKALGFVNSSSSRQLVYHIVFRCLFLGVSRVLNQCFNMCCHRDVQLRSPSRSCWQRTVQ